MQFSYMYNDSWKIFHRSNRNVREFDILFCFHFLFLLHIGLGYWIRMRVKPLRCAADTIHTTNTIEFDKYLAFSVANASQNFVKKFSHVLEYRLQRPLDSISKATENRSNTTSLFMRSNKKKITHEISNYKWQARACQARKSPNTIHETIPSLWLIRMYCDAFRTSRSSAYNVRHDFLGELNQWIQNWRWNAANTQHQQLRLQLDKTHFFLADRSKSTFRTLKMNAEIMCIDEIQLSIALIPKLIRAHTSCNTVCDGDICAYLRTR